MGKLEALASVLIHVEVGVDMHHTKLSCKGCNKWTQFAKIKVALTLSGLISYKRADCGNISKFYFKANSNFFKLKEKKLNKNTKILSSKDTV